MADQSERDPVLPDLGLPVPPLHPRLADPIPVIAVGTTLWFLAWVVLMVARLAFDAGNPVWMWTCLAGWLLGIVGYGVFRWQRSAARRGTRGAQRIV